MHESADLFSHFDLGAMSLADSYKLLASVVLPRPIAWVVSRDAESRLNAAPFSFFNILSADPPVVGISFARATDRGHKDTLDNILKHHGFVVNLVPEELAEAMNITAVDAPRGTDELQLAGLDMLPCATVDVPRIAGSPVALECTLLQTTNFGGSYTLALAHVVYVHVRTSAMSSPERLHVDPAQMRLIGRMHGGGGYCTTRDLFNIDRRKWPL